MKVILKDNIEYLGKKGDIVKVAPGYGRNYLLPKKLALEVTASNMKMIEMVQKSLRKGLEKEMKVYQSLIEKLNAVTLTFSRKSGEKDTIFGSVSVTDIRDALAEQSFEVEKKKILLDEPIKRLGNYTIPIKVFHDDRAQIKLEVVREGGAEEEEPAEPEAADIPIAPEIEPEPTEAEETKPEQSVPEALETELLEAPPAPEPEAAAASEVLQESPESPEPATGIEEPAAAEQEPEAESPEPEKAEEIPVEPSVEADAEVPEEKQDTDKKP
jgi:large subunit ribosomal protein L9